MTHAESRANLRSCPETSGCPICHPPDMHLWRAENGAYAVWRMVWGPNDLDTGSLKAKHAQCLPALRSNPVPALIRAVASDGRIHHVEALSRVTRGGLIRVATRANGGRQ